VEGFDIMTMQNLFRSFSRGITWNALFFVFYKLSVTLLAFVLFYVLTPGDFSTWANTNSIIFLLLLWLDFGLRKSIPRYAPFFAQQKRTQQLFIGGLVIVQISLLFCALPLFIAGAQRLALLLQLPVPSLLLPLASVIFFTEGCVALMRLIFHAHFWIREFNQLAMVIVGIELAVDLMLAWVLHMPSHTLVHLLFITKSIASFTLIVTSSYMLKKLYTHAKHPGDTDHALCTKRPPIRQFITHSFVMGTFTNLKSLSERNFLLPFLTVTLGASQANLFKIANDSALLFYRTILKTIGTTDTALLAHAQLLEKSLSLRAKHPTPDPHREKENIEPDKKEILSVAFSKLKKQILWLCIPMLAILIFLIPFKDRLFFDMHAMHAFFIMVFGYIFEAFLSPYERLLEIQRCYREIFIAYVPYCLTILYVLTHTQSLSLTSVLFIFHSTRLLGAGIIVGCAKQKFAV
jgi:hypothetical protein